jgi:hypothetical protein
MRTLSLRMFAQVALSLTIVFALAGCDTLYGVRRSARLDSLPPLDCVRRVIRETPGVASVTESHDVSGRELTLTGLHPAGDVYYFRFQGTNESHVLGVVHFVTAARRLSCDAHPLSIHETSIDPSSMHRMIATAV